MTLRAAVAAALALGCSEAPPPAAPEASHEESSPIAVTKWTARTELFMEYDPLEAGQNSRFAIHLTDLASFRPVSEGRVIVTLDYGDSAEEFASDRPGRPGIFGVDVTPSRPGSPSMSVALHSAAFEDRHLLGTAEVRRRGSGQEEPPAGEDAGPGIAYLKEQQWAMDFATTVVVPEAIRESVVIPAVVEVRPGGRTILRAPVAGRLLASPEPPGLGDRIDEDTELWAVAPLPEDPLDRASLQAALDRAEVELETARRDRQRAERLVEAGAVPNRRLEDARAREKLAVTQLGAAKSQMDRYQASRQADPFSPGRTAHAVRSHIAGIVTRVFASSGALVEDGEALLEVADIATVHVSGAVPEARSRILQEIQAAELEFTEAGGTVAVGEAIHVGKVVDPATRTLKVTYRVPNRDGRLALGQAVRLRLFTSAPVRLPAVPQSAVVDWNGQDLLYVQTGGETFEARAATLGSRQGGWVHVRSGLNEGERVVTEGAYPLHLASVAPETPAAGHAH